MSGPIARAQVVGLNLAWALSRRRAVQRFAVAVRDPERAQGRWLARFLTQNAGTAFGRAFGYAGISSVAQFRARVPVTSWDGLAPWVERIAQGEREVLTRAPVRVLERTSGSVAGPKLIPYTDGLLEDFGAATGPWLDDVARAFPALLSTRQYWSLSPAGRPSERSVGGVKIGLEDDTEYFDAATRFAMKRLFVVDGAVGRVADLAAWRTQTLAQLVAAEDLGFVSIWNPSFLTVLMDALERDWVQVRTSLTPARRARIDAGLQRAGAFVGEAVWPRLQLISCWTDAWAATALPALRRYFPSTPFQGKGLLATEGVVSFPLWGDSAPVAAVASHFLEFESLDDGRVFGVHALREGAAYAPLLTTRGGFARYRLSDVVRCVGFFHRAPLLRFEGRLDRTSDLRGEKLNAVFVERALREALAGRSATFAFVVPDVTGPHRYVLYLEGCADAHAVAQALDRLLRSNPHYAYARDLGQLAAVEPRVVVDGAARVRSELQRQGVRLGDIKPGGFDPRPIWAQVLASA